MIKRIYSDMRYREDDRYVFSEHFPKLFVELDAGDYECGEITCHQTRYALRKGDKIEFRYYVIAHRYQNYYWQAP